MSARRRKCCCLCAMWAQRLSIQKLFHRLLTSLCVSKQRPCSCHMGALCTEPVHTESLIQWNKWGQISTQASLVNTVCAQHSGCSSDFICLMCLGPLGLCSLFIWRTGLHWATCSHNLGTVGLKSSCWFPKADNFYCRVRLMWDKVKLIGWREQMTLWRHRYRENVQSRW